MVIDDVIGKIGWRKMKCFVELFCENRLQKVGVCVPPPPFFYPRMRIDSIRVESYLYDNAHLVSV